MYVDGKRAFGMQVRDFNADDVAMVEVYGSGGGGRTLTESQMDRILSAGNACGEFAGLRAVETGRGQLRYVQRPRPGIVSSVYIWLKK